jgi:hypothetical protein
MKETTISILDVIVEERLYLINIDFKKRRREGASLLYLDGTLNKIEEALSQLETSQN